MGGVFVGALEALHVALETGEDGVGVEIDLAERAVFGHAEEILEAVFPELGVGASETAHVPVAADQDVDVEALLGSDWGMGFEILVGEGFKIRGVFAADDGGLSINAGFQGIHADDGLALEGARTGGFLRVETVGLELFQGSHEDSFRRRDTGGNAGAGDGFGTERGQRRADFPSR